MNNNMQTTKERVKSYILQSAYASEGEIKDDTLIFSEGYFDSMGFVMLISFLDEELGIKVMEAELIEENFESINAITNFIIQKTN
jgi:acyl carrier protein